jgi:hypothetical protein
MMTRPKFRSACPALSLALALVPALLLAACGSDDPLAPESAVVVTLEGVVLSDAWEEPLNVPVLVPVFRSDGSGGWNETEANQWGEWSMEVELRNGCEPGETLEAAAWISAPDHGQRHEDLGGGQAIVCDSGNPPLEYSLFREVFREPVAVAGGLQASRLSGFNSTCAVTEQGVFCWGPGVPEPVLVAGGEGFEAVESGNAHTCALDTDGAAWCWGSNQNGVLGVPGIGSSTEPVSVVTDRRFVELAANLEATCGRDVGGQLFCWGMSGDETPFPLEVICASSRSAGVPPTCAGSRRGQAGSGAGGTTTGASWPQPRWRASTNRSWWRGWRGPDSWRRAPCTRAP